ncbi:MAG: hypothetical protein HY812_13890 [Planctomycetes bacterium]|nr:hypothetical protein [Planctomycetota bacterium]
MRVLVTSGPSREPIDEVRYVSNVSSGKLGLAVAQAFARAGHAVVLLRGRGSAAPEAGAGVAAIEFSSALSLLEAARRVLTGADAPDLLIHAAAVADYAPEPAAGKLKSSALELVVRMKPTPKVVDEIRRLRPDLPIILFKLEARVSRGELHRRALESARRVGAAAVVANLLEEVTEGRHRADLLRGDGSLERLDGREAIAAALVREAEGILRAVRGKAEGGA